MVIIISNHNYCLYIMIFFKYKGFFWINATFISGELLPSFFHRIEAVFFLFLLIFNL